MADRIFPTKAQAEALDSEQVLTTIDWNDVERRLAESKNGGGNERTSNEKIAELLAYLKESEEDDTEVREAKRDTSHLDEFKFKKKDEKESDEHEDDEEDVEDEEHLVKHGKEAEAAAPRGKVVFSSIDQISPEALEKALEEGDTALYNTILAARHQYRQSVAAKADEAVKELVDNQAKLAKRAAYREKLASTVEEAQKAIKTASKAQPKKKSVAAKAEPAGDGFVKGTDLKGAAREAFIRKAQALGMSEEDVRDYVTAMLGGESAISESERAIREILSSALPKEVKAAAVKSMSREAKLTDADYSRLKDYWKNELGYGDEEWIDDLFSAKYDS